MAIRLTVVVRSCFCHDPMNNDAQVLDSEKHRKGPKLKGPLLERRSMTSRPVQKSHFPITRHNC